MSLHRFYSKEPLLVNASIRLPHEEEHHLRHVMRIKKGEKIEIVDGKGALATGIFQDPLISVTSLERKEGKLTHAALFQSLTEPAKLEWIVEKGTELGITSFWFFPLKKSKLSHLSDSKKERLEKITISALKQSGRLFLPEIHYFSSMESFPSHIPNLYIAQKGGSPPNKIVKGSSGIIVGPESGFTEEELLFFQNSASATPIHLSDNTLRAETAAIIASFLIA